MSDFIAAERVAMRVEGSWWVAYLARLETMKDSVEIARLRVDFAEDDAVEEAFREFIKLIMVRRIEKAGHGLHHIETQEAPESERSGNA